MQTLETILACEQAGVPKVWLGALPFGVDPLTIITVAGERTRDLVLGTGIVTTYPRHPAVLATQAITESWRHRPPKVLGYEKR